MSTPQPTLVNALLKDALSRRSDGPLATGELLDDVLTAVGATSQQRPWVAEVLRMARPLAIVAVAALLLAAIVAGALVAGGQLRQPADSSILGQLPRPAEAPLATGELPAIVGQYEAIHTGYVYVYADGRVVFDPDSKAVVSSGGVFFALNQRRLTESGVDLVRSGTVPASAFLTEPWRIPASAWADPVTEPYVPLRYALCYRELRADVEISATRVLGQLPAAAQSLLRGTARTYAPGGFSALNGSGAQPESRECAEVTAYRAGILFEVLADAGWHRGDGADSMTDPNATWSPTSIWDDESLGIRIEQYPILPHGTFQYWGG